MRHCQKFDSHDTASI